MISVIVPTYNRQSCLFAMLESINRQKNIDFEVIVVDQSETIAEEKIDAVLEKCRNLRYYHINKRGRSIAKNFGIEQSSKEIVLFCDDDIIADNNFLAEHIHIHGNYENVGALSCHLIEPHQEIVQCSMPLKITPYGRFINVPNSLYNGFVTSLNGGNMSFKRKALQEIGYFDENLRGTSMLEEPDFAYRLLKRGYRLYFSSGTRVKHFPQYNGNITIKGTQKREWLKSYFFNQYFFMIKNKRFKCFPLLFTYLVYRALFESIKISKMPFGFLDLPFTALWQAHIEWRRKKVEYSNPWFTPITQKIEVLKYKAN